MSRITTKQILHLSKLSNINLTDEQVASFEDSLEGIISYMKQVNDLEIKKGVEVSRVTDQHNAWREDEVKPSLTQEQALKNAKKKHKGFFVTDYLLKSKNVT